MVCPGTRAAEVVPFQMVSGCQGARSLWSSWRPPGLLSLVTPWVDDGELLPQSITGDAGAALQILYLIAFSMLTLTGLVLSLVVVVVQLAMGVFSPRIVRQILQDRPSQVAIGLFAGTFAHAILAMRASRVGPAAGDQLGVPAQQGSWRHQPQPALLRTRRERCLHRL